MVQSRGMGTMENRWKRRQGEAAPPEPPPPPDVSHLTEEQRLEAWQRLHANHLERQTKAVESIRTYVAVWFWLTIAGAVLVAVSINSSSYY